MRTALLDVLRDGTDVRVQLPSVWPAVREWLALPLGADGGELLFDGYVAGGRAGAAASIEVPAGVSTELVVCLEVMRQAPTAPSVGIGLYYPCDGAWLELMSQAEWMPDQPFLVERWTPDTGSPDAFVALVERSAFFQLALGKRADVVVVFDGGEIEDIRLHG
jgi:hypothetical protein